MDAKHIDTVAALESEYFTQPFSKTLFLQELKNPNALYFVDCLEDGTIRGYGGFNFVADEGNITTILTASQYRRKGIAGRLLRMQIVLCKTLGIKQLHLEVRESNHPARKFYIKHGFCEVGRRINYYDKPREDAILMTLELYDDDNIGL